MNTILLQYSLIVVSTSEYYTEKQGQGNETINIKVLFPWRHCKPKPISIKIWVSSYFLPLTLHKLEERGTWRNDRNKLIENQKLKFC